MTPDLLHADHHAERIDAHDGVEVRLVHIQKRHGLVETRIVEKHIDTAEALAYGSHHGPHLRPLGHIHGDTHRLLPGVAQGGRHGLRLLHVEVRDDKRPALFCRPPHDAFAQARCAASDDDDAVR